MMSGDLDVDVVVIGGGLSGLACATVLKENGCSVLVLEARERVGGRTCTECSSETMNVPVDAGGAYVGPGQLRLMRYAKKHGVQTYPVYCKGKKAESILSNSDEIQFYTQLPYHSFFSLLDINNSMVKLEEKANSINKSYVWQSKNAEALDKFTVDEWVKSITYSEVAYETMSAAFQCVTCQPMDQMSMLTWLSLCGSAVSGKHAKVMRLFQVHNGAQERKFVGGSMQISEKIAGQLGKDSLLLNHAVKAVEQENNSCVITCGNGSSFKCKYCVLALSPALYKNFNFSPELPSKKKKLYDGFAMGKVIKTVTYYKTAWWRDHGFSGELLSRKGPVYYSIDDCKPDGSTPAIMGFILSTHAEEWMEKTKEERSEAIREQYYNFFKVEEAKHPIGYFEKNWMEEEFSGGCYCAYSAVDTLYKYGEALREPFKNLHFASTELAKEWIGYMDGALESGEREAYKILNKLKANENESSVFSPEPEVVPKDFPMKSITPGIAEKLLSKVFSFFYPSKGPRL